MFLWPLLTGLAYAVRLSRMIADTKVMVGLPVKSVIVMIHAKLMETAAVAMLMETIVITVYA